MNIFSEVYGARAKVYIDFDKSIEELGRIIEKTLNLNSLRIEHDEYEPYDLVGSSEVLGFELDLTHIEGGFYKGEYCYLLSIETTDCFDEVMNDRMYDISLWFARYISLVCDLKTIVETTIGESRRLTKFWYELPNKKTEVIEL